MDKLFRVLIQLNEINGGTCWDRQDESIYNPIGFSTIDFLSIIGDLDCQIENDITIESGIQKTIKYYDKKTCLFRFSPTSSKLPYVTAKILVFLQKHRYHFEEMENCYQYFLKTQKNDGGWRCAVVKIGKSPETDASNPGTTLYVLDAFRYRKNSAEVLTKLNKGVDFLLDHWNTRKPLGPCGFGIGTTFMKTEYPFYRYNIFYYTYVLSFYPCACQDKRFLEVMEILRKKKTSTGIKIEKPHKNWKAILFEGTNECEISNGKYLEIENNLRINC